MIIFKIDMETRISNKNNDNGQAGEHRGRCFACKELKSGSINAKTNTKCAECSKFVCKNHQRVFCTVCVVELE